MILNFKLRVAPLPATRWLAVLCMTLLAPVVVAAAAAAATTTEAGDAAHVVERRQFSEALDALNAGDDKRYNALRTSLANYPLRDYLEYERKSVV